MSEPLSPLGKLQEGNRNVCLYSLLHLLGIATDLTASLLDLVTFAIIETPNSSRPIPSPSTSRRQSGATSSAHSTPRPASRRSEVNSQLYQFALGYPLTPPDTSPVKELSESFLQTEASGLRGSMGSFVFKWCVRDSGQRHRLRSSCDSVNGKTAIMLSSEDVAQHSAHRKSQAR